MHIGQATEGIEIDIGIEILRPADPLRFFGMGGGFVQAPQLHAGPGKPGAGIPDNLRLAGLLTESEGVGEIEKRFLRFFPVPQRAAEPGIEHPQPTLVGQALGNLPVGFQQLLKLSVFAIVVVNKSPLDEEINQELLISFVAHTSLHQQLIGFSKVLVRLLHGIAVEALLTRLDQVIHCLIDRLSLPVMKREGFINLGQAVAEQVLHHLPDPLMDNLTLFLEEPVVDHLLRNGMLENVLELSLGWISADQIELFEAVQATLQPLL